MDWTKQHRATSRVRTTRRRLGSVLAVIWATIGVTAVGVATSGPAVAAAFGNANVVVVRVGTGAAALNNAATAVFLDEYTPSGTLVQSIPLPTTASGTDQPFTTSGSATSEGALARSADGRYLTLAGYTAALGTTGVASTATPAVPRVIARVDAAGDVDTSTTIPDAFSANNVRGAVTDDGSRFWAGGGNSGIRFVEFGASTSSVASGGTTATNFRSVAIFDGQLYASSGTAASLGVHRIGTGLPTSGAGLTTVVAPASAYAYVFLDRSAAVPGVDALYVADDTANTGGVLKYSFDGTAWTARGSFRPASQSARGLTGTVQPDGSVQLFATTATSTALVAVTDTAAFDATFAGSGTTIATPATNTAFRGVAFAPRSVTTSPSIVTSPASTTVLQGSTTELTVTADGSSPLTYQWYQGPAGDVSTPVGTDSPAFTTPALTTTTSYWVRVTNSAGSADSAAATVTVQIPPPNNTAPTITPEPVQPLALTIGEPQPAPRTVTVADAESAADALAVTITSSDPTIATASATTTGADRSIEVTPLAVGTATLTIEVDDGELTDTTTFDVAVSAGGPMGSINLYGISDASTAIDLGDGHMVVADDETDVLRVYSRTTSAYPVTELDLRAAGLALPVTGNDEIDLEAAARVGSTVYWVGSLGQSTAGSDRPNRRVLFTTVLTGTGATTALTIGGAYHGLRDDLVAWDVANGDALGLATAAALAPEAGGLSLEGVEFAPDGTTLYLGLRSPLLAGSAIVIPLTNAAALVAGNPATGVTAQFGPAFDWDLDGRGVRELRRNTAGQYVVVAGPVAGTGAAGEFRLYTWNGDPATAPALRNANLDALAALGGVETLVDVPDPLTDASQLQFVVDAGDTVWYGDGVVNKDLAPTAFRKVVAGRVALGSGPLCSSVVTLIGSVQGTGDTSPLVGQTVTVRGTVVGDYEGPSPALRGFYLQDGGDSNAATSDGVFVFNNLGGASPDSVGLGQIVEVTGTVAEFQGQTQLSATAIASCGQTGSVTPTELTLPRTSAGDLEPFEGMLVRFSQTLTVTEHFQLGRFGQVIVSSGGRLRQPTAVHDGGSTAAAALRAQNALNRLTIDDATNGQNPDPIVFGRNGAPLSASNTLRGGDTVTAPVGVLTYTWAGNAASPNTYRLRPINALGGSAEFVAANPRPSGAPAVGGDVQVAGFNLLNFFNTFSGCTLGTAGGTTDCRGAENSTEYGRQLTKAVAALTSLDADVIGVMELENDGYGPTSAISALVDAMNAAEGAGTWSFVDTDAETGVTDAAGTDAIKVALLYRTASVEPVDGATFAFGSTGVFERNPVAQTFSTPDGSRITVVVNHFKSKGSCPTSGLDTDQGDGQGCWNARRTAQASALVSWLDSTVIPAAGAPDVVVLGDLNSYAAEDPIQVLEAAGYVDLAEAFHGTDAYSYGFDGQWGYLDYLLASASLRPATTGVVEVHINADEPSVLDYNTNFKSAGQIASLYAPDRFRTSDHDPIVAGFELEPGTVTPPGAPTGITAVSDGDDVRLTWTDNANNEDGFDLLRARQITGTWQEWTVVDSPAADVTAVTDVAVADGVYAYLVRARNAAGTSEWSITTIEHPTATAPPSAPTGVVATTTGNGVSVTWTDTSATEQYHELLRARYDATSQDWSEWTAHVLDRDVTGFTDPAVPDGRYAYLVRTVNGAGASDWAITTIAHTTTTSTPTAPSGLVATASAGGVEVTWTDTSSTEHGFEIMRATFNGSAWGSWTSWTADTDTVAFTDGTTATGTTYAYLVRAYNPNGASEWVIGVVTT